MEGTRSTRARKSVASSNLTSSACSNNLSLLQWFETFLPILPAGAVPRPAVSSCRPYSAM
ncbi:hypothetical protein BT63DRAFT_422129, partial [Microthyrium microscopicum]